MSGVSTIKNHFFGLNRRLTRRLRRFARHERGIAATEFALILPIMMAMYFGLVELSSAIGHDRKGVLLSRTLADMVTQSLAITNADMNTIFNASSSILSPYPVERVAMRVTSYLMDANGNAFVDWSDVKNTSGVTPFAARTRCTPSNAVVPAGLRVKNSSLVQSEVLINHKPTIGYVVVPSGVNMQENLFMRPRISTAVTRAGVSTATCPGFT